MEEGVDRSQYDLYNETNLKNETYRLPAVEIRTAIQTYVLPSICIFGLICNTLALITFVQKPLRNKSCSLYLAVRSLSDNGFLATLLMIWMSGTFQLKLGSILGICQVIVFFTYVCGCISVWLVVFVTAENYIRICHPFNVPRLCTTKYAKILIGILSIVTLGFYNFPLWISEPDCSPSPVYYEVTQAFIYTDTLLTFIIPVLLVAVLMTSIFCSLLRSYSWRGKYSIPSAQRVRNPMAKITRMLLAVSVIFFLMNIPSHVIRLQILINSFLQGYTLATPFEGVVQTITYQIYYLSLGINLVVYLVFGSQFREVFKQTFLPRNTTSPTANLLKSVNTQSPKRVSTTIMMDAVNSTCTVAVSAPHG